jgi:hypothetical protein
METGLSELVLKLYHSVSGNSHYSIDDVCDEFSMEVISEPLTHDSRIFGKIPKNRHILENELGEKNIDVLLQGAQ